jgi:hypothetical protein
VHTQVAIHFLNHAVGHLGPQHQSRAALVGFQLIEGGFDFPPLGVELGEFGGGRRRGIGDGGDEPVGAVGAFPSSVGAGGVERIFHHSHIDLPDVLVPAMTAPTYDAELFTALEPKLDALVEELTWWTTTLRWGRQPSSEPVAAQA